MVADVTRCDVKMTFLGNVGRVVAETLEVAGDEDEIDAGLGSGISRRR